LRLQQYTGDIVALDRIHGAVLGLVVHVHAGSPMTTLVNIVLEIIVDGVHHGGRTGSAGAICDPHGSLGIWYSGGSGLV
jgi:hypothetical protein